MRVQFQEKVSGPDQPSPRISASRKCPDLTCPGPPTPVVSVDSPIWPKTCDRYPTSCPGSAHRVRSVSKETGPVPKQVSGPSSPDQAVPAVATKSQEMGPAGRCDFRTSVRTESVPQRPLRIGQSEPGSQSHQHVVPTRGMFPPVVHRRRAVAPPRHKGSKLHSATNGQITKIRFLRGPRLRLAPRRVKFCGRR